MLNTLLNYWKWRLLSEQSLIVRYGCFSNLIQCINPKQDEALYYMLLTQAEDKCYVKHQSDSLISLAVDYFRHSGDDLRLARSLYTNGRVEYDLGNHAEAAELYVEAMDVAKGSEDYNIQYLICSHLGTIYYKTKMSEKALAFYIKLFYWLFYV